VYSTDVKSLLVGSWSGIASNAWTDDYAVEFVYWDTGRYSCHSLNPQEVCFYYGYDYESPSKVLQIDTEGDETTGIIQIFWNYGDKSSGYTTKGTIRDFEFLSPDNVTFNFYNTWLDKEIGPFRYILQRTSIDTPPMCDGYCHDFALCNFTSQACYTNSDTTPTDDPYSSSGVDPTPMPVISTQSSSISIIGVLGIIVGSVLIVLGIAMICYVRRRNRNNAHGFARMQVVAAPKVVPNVQMVQQMQYPFIPLTQIQPNGVQYPIQFVYPQQPSIYMYPQ